MSGRGLRGRRHQEGGACAFTIFSLSLLAHYLWQIPKSVAFRRKNKSLFHHHSLALKRLRWMGS